MTLGTDFPFVKVEKKTLWKRLAHFRPFLATSEEERRSGDSDAQTARTPVVARCVPWIPRLRDKPRPTLLAADAKARG